MVRATFTAFHFILIHVYFTPPCPHYYQNKMKLNAKRSVYFTFISFQIRRADALKVLQCSKNIPQNTAVKKRQLHQFTPQHINVPRVTGDVIMLNIYAG